MNLADVIRPQIFNVSKDALITEMSASNNVFEADTGELMDILIAPTLIISDQIDQGGKHMLPIDPNMLTEERFRVFNNHTYSIGKMVRLAEFNLDSLSGVVGLYFHIHPFDEVIKRNADCSKLQAYDVPNNFNKLTFGNLRNILSCIVKSDEALHTIDDLDTAAKRKNFTSVYNGYIEDRDRYTHGILFYIYPTFEPILRIKNNQGDSTYIKYSKEVFVSNLKVYEYLQVVLNKIRDNLQGRATPSAEQN